MERRTHTLPLDSEERKKVPLYRGFFRYFPAAIAWVARVSWIGNEKHNPGQPMHHARWKSMDQEDCQLRHLMDLAEDFGAGIGRDEQGIPQLAYDAWRALAALQQWCEQHDGAPIAPGARLSPDHPITPLPSEEPLARPSPWDQLGTITGNSGTMGPRPQLLDDATPEEWNRASAAARRAPRSPRDGGSWDLT